MARAADRRIEKPSERGKAERSLPGVPTRNRHIPALGDYMFGEMVQPHWDAVTTGIVGSTATDTVSATPAIEAMSEIRAAPTSGAPASDTTSGEVSEAISAETPPPTEEPGAVPSSIDPDRAKIIAEATFDADPLHMAIYWPMDWTDRDDFDSTTLIPALEAMNASSIGWPGSGRFLAAVKDGRGRECIAICRQQGIDALARDILSRMDKALAKARAAGFEV